MFTQISLMGRVTADLEIQTSTNGTDYIQFNVSVNKGFGEQEHPNFYQCVLFGKATERISKAGVRTGITDGRQRGAAETDRKLCQDAGGLCGIPESRVQQKIPCGA